MSQAPLFGVVSILAYGTSITYIKGWSTGGNGTIVQALFHDSHREEETLGNDGSQSRVTVTRGRRHVARPEAGGEKGARTRTEKQHPRLRNGKRENCGPHQAKNNSN